MLGIFVRRKLQCCDVLRFLQSLQMDTTMDVGNARRFESRAVLFMQSDIHHNFCVFFQSETENSS